MFRFYHVDNLFFIVCIRYFPHYGIDKQQPEEGSIYFLAHGSKQNAIHYDREGMVAGASDSRSYQGRKQRVNRK